MSKDSGEKDLDHYQKLFPSGSKFKVVRGNNQGRWAKIGDEYTVGDVIYDGEDGFVIRTQEDLDKGYRVCWVGIDRCEPVESGTSKKVNDRSLLSTLSVSFDSDCFTKDFYDWMSNNAESLLQQFLSEIDLADYIKIGD